MNYLDLLYYREFFLTRLRLALIKDWIDKVMNIQWYPGHMTKAKREISKSISMVDVVIELLDARIPISSRNPDIDVLARDKKRIIILNKADLSDANINLKWKEYFEEKDFRVILANSKSGKGLDEIFPISKDLMKDKIERQKARGRIFVPVRGMILGIPNVGKSTLINKIVKKKIAKTGDKPGVTRANQWVKLRKDFELLDTPGILWPKFEDKKVGLNLAFTGAIKDEILDTYTLATKLIDSLLKTNPNSIKNRYNIELINDIKSHEILEIICERRGFILKGGIFDTEKSANIFLNEFRDGKLGLITLEIPEDFKTSLQNEEGF